MKKKICLKGLCLKVSDIKHKENRKKNNKLDAHICISSKPVPRLKAVKHNMLEETRNI